MPETPDFDQIARDALERWGINDGWSTATVRQITGEFADELRQVWNARGAADALKVDATVTMLPGADAGVVTLKRAIRSLDR